MIITLLLHIVNTAQNTDVGRLGVPRRTTSLRVYVCI